MKYDKDKQGLIYNEELLYADELIENARPLRKLKVLSHDDASEPLICDCCNARKPLVHINDLANYVSCICKDCLQAMANLLKDDNSEW